MPPKDPTLLGVARTVRPEALCGLAERLGWVPVSVRRTDLAVYHHPTVVARQVLIPTVPSYDDFGELVQEAVDRLAAFEGRPFDAVLVELTRRPAVVVG